MVVKYDSLIYGVLNIFIDTNMPDQKPLLFNQSMMSYSESNPDSQQTSTKSGGENTEGNSMISPLRNYLGMQGGEPTTPQNGVVIVMNTRFPERMFQKLMRKPPKERIRYFFNRQLFEKMLLSYLTDASTILPESEENKINIAEIIEYNITQTLGILFPTSLPTNFNISTSYGEFISKGSQPLTFPNVSPFLSRLPSAYSYITINGKKYTITKVLWLNDLYNHPVYREFILQYKDFYGKLDREESKIENDYNDVIKKFYHRFVSNSQTTRGNSSLRFYDAKYTDIITAKIDSIKTTTQNDRLSKFKDNLTSLSKKIEEFRSIIEDDLAEIANPSTDSDIKREIANTRPISRLNIIIETIIQLYSEIRKDTYGSITLDKTFLNQIEAADKEIDTLYPLEIIKNDYISKKYINLNMANEDPNVVKKMQSNYKWYFDFIEKMKEINPPNRISLNHSFQGLLKSFTVDEKTEENERKKELFTELLEFVKYIIVYKKPFDTYSDLFKEMKVGACQVDLRNRNQDTFEIYIMFDLIEDEVNDSNVKEIECSWRGLTLGNYVGNILEKTNKFGSEYDAKERMVLVKKDELYANIKNNKASAPKTGGRKTRKRRVRINKVKRTTHSSTKKHS